MTRTTWTIGLTLVAAAALQLTLMATGVAGIPPDDRGRPAGAPASIQLSPEPAIISCDGIDASTVTVRVTDSRGRAVPDGTLVYFDAQYGFVEPVEATTKRGEASTQASLYDYARNFPEQTGVDVFVDGGLRASIGIDCAPEEPPCDPTTPPPHPQSPPCPEPGTCNFPFSPPVHSQSPPCTDPEPCNFPFSPPLHVMSPPCGTPTPEPCQSASPPCAPNEMRLDGDPSLPGVQSFVTHDIGDRFRIGVHITRASEWYRAYQWVLEWPKDRLEFHADITESGPAIGMNICVDALVDPLIDPAYNLAHAGGCGAASNFVDFTGEVTTSSFSCVSAGVQKIALRGPISDSQIFSTLIASTPIDTATEGLFVECAPPLCEQLPCPTATPTPTPIPYGFGTIRFESYEPVTATVGAPFKLSIEAVGVTAPYQGYNWLVGTSDAITVTGDDRSLAHGFDICADAFEAYPHQYSGGCITFGPTLTEIHLGRLHTIDFQCLTPGSSSIALLADPLFGTALYQSTGDSFGGPDTSVIDVTCSNDSGVVIHSPTPTPAPLQRGRRGLQ